MSLLPPPSRASPRPGWLSRSTATGTRSPSRPRSPSSPRPHPPRRPRQRGAHRPRRSRAFPRPRAARLSTPAPATSAGLSPEPSPSAHRSAREAPRARPARRFTRARTSPPGAGTPIGAVAAGTVRVSTTHPEYGQYVIIDHQIDGRLVSTLYAHMIFGSSPLRPGDTVAVGQLVGLVGNTGASTGAHLHLQVMPGGTTPIDPIPWLTANAGRTL
nr:peptidoglycan DD-metalloendopeptidase family protein [uncultured Curtobacterium sp.]